MTSETSMVELRRVTKRWGSFTAVADVSLEVRAGEFMTFLGPSGCGKAMFLPRTLRCGKSA